VFLEGAMKRAADSAAARMAEVSASDLERRIESAPQRAAFKPALASAGGPVRVIAEVKRRSPSAGEIRPGARVKQVVREYESGGAAAVSILTSADFGGRLDDLAEASTATGLPLLRKDFVSCEYQVLEAAAFGASAVLLISDALEGKRLESLIGFAEGLGLDALVEAHRRESLEKALTAGAAIVGINNRDLRTLEVDLSASESLLRLVPPGMTTVSESGIKTREDVSRVRRSGADAILVGEELMRAERPAERLRELMCVGEAVTAVPATAASAHTTETRRCL
jgi:indole-3-glycerol phosphate synthase